MDFIKQYIVQCISVAGNNLRLNSEKIESITILREFLLQSENLAKDIETMKKVTELSKFGIKLGDIHRYISANKIDFFTLSEKFKEQSHALIRELSHLLDIITSSKLRQILNERVKPIESPKPEIEEKTIESSTKSDFIILPPPIEKEDQKEKIKLSIVDEIRDAAALINTIENGEVPFVELSKHIVTINEFAPRAADAGMSDLSKMLTIFGTSIKELKAESIICDDQTLEGMRACLIVAAAIARNKNVDVSVYKKKAEQFGERMSINQIKGNE